MHRNDKNPSVNKADDSKAVSENLSENAKYMRKLALQRSVLNKLVESKITVQPDEGSPIMPENS